MFPKGIQNLQNRLILSKALEMGIDCKPLLAGCEDFLELSSQDRRIIINKTRSHHLPLIAGLLAKNKQVCNMLLEQQGMPVPSFVVLSEMGDEAVHFLEVNQSIVVKPLDASGSAGVTLDVRTVQEMETAIDRALAHSTSIMLQRFVRGIDYRVLVINGAIAAVNKYRPVFVEGDGISTIKELIQRLNQERLQLTHIGEYEAFPELEEDSAQLHQALRAQGVISEDVPSLGRQIELYLLRNSAAGNISEFYMDCTEDMHEANALMASQAANALQIDVAGIDIRCSDMRVPITKENGGILEVNALPDMTHHVFPHGGTTRDVVRMYLEYLVQHEL